jgi:hypothetical protein
MKEIYEKFSTPKEIREILKKTQKEKISFIKNIIRDASTETALEVSKYLENLFENDKIELRKILSHRDWFANTIFKEFKDKKEFEEKLKIFAELLRKTFDENENGEFEKYLKFLQYKLESVDDFRYFTENFNEIKETFGAENLKTFLLLEREKNKTILHEIIKDGYESFLEPFLDKIQTILNKNEILSLVFSQENRWNLTSFMRAAQFRKSKVIKVFWNFLDTNLNETEKREFLLFEQKASWTVLQLSTFNKDPKSFLFAKKIYEKFFSSEKIREILKKTEEKFYPFIYNVINDASNETALEVSKYLENLFKNEKVELRQILIHRFWFGDSIFKVFKDKKEFEEKLKIFIELLRKTFDQEKEFEFKLKYFQVPPIVLVLQNFSSDLQNFRTHDWVYGDFFFFITFFDEIKEKFGADFLKKVLLSKNLDEKYFTLLDEVIFYYKNENFIEPFLEKIQFVLNKTEILNLVFTQETEFKQTSFMYVTSARKLKVLKVFWNFLDENLNETEKRELLLIEQKGLLTAFQHSTWNKDPKSFLFIKELYEKFFTLEKCQEILKKTTDVFHSFLYGVIKDASPETALEVSKYLESLFQNEKIELRKLLSHQDINKYSIFSVFNYQKEFEEKVKLFIELLRKTFDSNENEKFEKNLKNLQENLNFFRNFSPISQNFEVLRSNNSWVTDDFKFFLDGFGEIRANFSYDTFRKNLFGYLNSNFLLELTYLNFNEDFVEPFLEKIQKVLIKSEIVALSFAQNKNFNKTPLMWAAWKMKLGNLKVFWNFIQKNLNEEERRKLLLTGDSDWWTALQYSTLNKDSNSFLFIKEIYEKFFTQAEIREILFKYNYQNLSFIGNVIQFASHETALEVSKYLEILYNNQKLELRKVLSYKAFGGNSIFKEFKDKTEYEKNLKVFTELLRKTFEENQEEEFKDTYLRLTRSSFGFG